MPTSKFLLFPSLSLSLFLLFLLGTHAQVQIPPTNVTTGFVNFPSGPKQVTWFYTQGDLVVYDGDVIFGTVAEFNRALINITYTSAPEQPPIIPKRRSYPPSLDSIVARSDSIFPLASGLWPGGEVFYRYFDTDTENELSTYVDGAIGAWTDAVPCITFSKVANDNDPNGSNGIVTIRANDPNAGICLASQIGFGTNSLWMGLDTGGGCGVPEVTHEWGHILGLIHEQKRPDAPQEDPFVCSNLIDYPFGLTPAQADAQCCGAPQKCPPPPDNNCCGFACQFTVECGDYNLQDIGVDGGTFDFNSIMLYRNDAFAKSGTSTLTNGPNQSQNPQSLSSEDILRVRELYGCLPPPQPQCPVGCDPASGANTCSFPTAQDCIYPSLSTPNPRGACACRAGYKATAPGILDTDTTKQWRLPADEGNFRVWVAQGVACDTLCDVSTGPDSCQEVIELSADCLHN